MAGPLHHLTPAPPLGWNSFDAFGCLARAEDLLRNLPVFAARLRPHGYEYFVLDAGWYRQYELDPGETYPGPGKTFTQCLDAHGRPSPAPWAFPDGLQPVIEAVHAAGARFGIHMMRGISREAVARKLPVAGTEYTADEIADPEDICPWCADNLGVDMDHPGAQPYYDGLIGMLASWGVDYIKYDDIVPAPREVDAVVAALAKCDRPIALSLSPGNEHVREAAESYTRANCMRVSGDVWDDRVYFIWDFERWEAFLPWVDDEAPGFWLDLDMIPFGHLKLCHPRRGDEDPEKPLMGGKGRERMSRLTAAQKRTFITIRALASSPLFMGGDLPTTDAESLDLLTRPEMLACNRHGLTGRPLAREEGLEIWQSPERHARRRGWVGVFNRHETEPLTLELTPARLGLDGPCTLHEIWSGQALTVGQTPAPTVIGPDDVLFLRY